MARDTITTEQLLAYAAGELDAAERAAIEAKLAQDPAAAATARLYATAREAISSDDSVAPPAEVMARAKALYEKPQTAPRASWLERAQQLVAELVFDSRTQPALAGVRSLSSACSLVFETEEASVDLQAEPKRDADGRIIAWQVVGQVAQTGDMRACPVVFLRKDDHSVAAEAALDERGVFTVEVEPGIYEIRFGLRAHNLIVPQFDVS